MKTDKEINDIIKQGLEEYAKAETKSEDTTDVTFSKEHEEKMKNVFDNARKQAKPKKPEDREFVIRIKFGMATKVAVAAIVVMVFVSAVSTGIKAWKASRLNSYEGSGDYSWLLPNNTSEVYEKKTPEEAIEYVKGIFPGLSGEITEIELEKHSRAQRIRFKNNEKYINLKTSNTINFALDVKLENTSRIYIGDTEILYYEENEIASYI